MKPADRDLLHGLLSALVDGTITDEQATQLARMLAADADARRFYVRYLDMHAALRDAASQVEAAPRRSVPWVAIAASLIAASLLLAWLAPFAGGPGIPAGQVTPASLAAADTEPAGYVATIASAKAGAVLNDAPAIVGGRLTPGRYVVAGGVLTVQFDGGAQIFFNAGSRFRLRSRRAMAIEHGTFVFEGDQTCESIEILTPHSVFRNIGTRYAAVIAADAEEVHVADGAVRRTTGNGSRPPRHELIEAGVGRRYGAAGAAAEVIPLDETLVSTTLDDPPAAGRDSAATVVDFFRGDGDLVKGLRTGRGWAEPWRSRKGALRPVSPGLDGADSVALLHDGTGGGGPRRRSAAHRTLAEPIDLSKDGVWYLRFLIRRSAAAANDEHRATVVLRTHGVSPAEELEQGSLIQIAFRREDAALVRVADRLTRASLPQVSGERYAVVAKIVAGREKPEQVLVRLMAVDRLAESEEPSDWSLVSDSVHTDMRLDQLSLECASGGRIEFGDLCIGPTWESVARPAGSR